MIGIVQYAGSGRIFLLASKPSITSICTFIRVRSNLLVLQASNACSPSVAPVRKASEARVSIIFLFRIIFTRLSSTGKTCREIGNRSPSVFLREFSILAAVSRALCYTAPFKMVYNSCDLMGLRREKVCSSWRTSLNTSCSSDEVWSTTRGAISSCW